VSCVTNPKSARGYLCPSEPGFSMAAGRPEAVIRLRRARHTVDLRWLRHGPSDSPSLRKVCGGRKARAYAGDVPKHTVGEFLRARRDHVFTSSSAINNKAIRDTTPKARARPPRNQRQPVDPSSYLSYISLSHSFSRFVSDLQGTVEIKTDAGIPARLRC
jgi:hypothetical protein